LVLKTNIAISHWTVLLYFYYFGDSEVVFWVHCICWCYVFACVYL